LTVLGGFDTMPIMKNLCMRHVFAFAAALGAFVAFGAATTASTATKSQATLSKYERLAAAMLPQDKVERAKGFFGPIVKKYQPTFDRFQSEFQTAKNKREVVEKYLPDAESALADAKTMKVPAKYEAEKAEYIRMADTFMSVLRVTVAIGK